MTDESPEPAGSETERPGPVPADPTRPPATDEDFTGVCALLLILLLPHLLTQLPYEVLLLARYSYWKNVSGIAHAVSQIALVWLIIRRTRGTWAEVGLVRRVRFLDLPAAAAMVVFAHVLHRFAMKLFYPDTVDAMLAGGYGERPDGVVSWSLTVVRIAVAAFAEELVFRGYLYTRLERLLSSPLWATLLAALLFGVVHLNHGTVGALGAVFFGVLTTVAFAATRRLWPTTLAHAAYNLSLVLLATEPEFVPESEASGTRSPKLQW